MSNLVGNAVEHGLAEQPITMAVDGRGEALRVTLRNGGVIDAELLPKLFAPFKGPRKGTSSTGLGLGLYISEQIIRAHGGTIEVRSTAEDGTTFSIELPRRPPAERKSPGL